MLAKCANPSCSTPLVYLREGKIFMMDHAPEPSSNSEAIKQSRTGNRVEHFWLCGPCSAEYTLVYRLGMGVQVEPKPRASRTAAA
jgi:hypothetical protein